MGPSASERTDPDHTGRKAIFAASKERRLAGLSVAPGVAVGRPCMVEVSQRHSTAAAIELDSEGERAIGALTRAQAQLQRFVQSAAERGDRLGAEIFEAHVLILTDATVKAALLEQVALGGSAASAIRDVFDGYVATFEAVADDYLRSRAADFAELEAHLLHVLNECQLERSCRDAAACTIEHCALENPHILIGEQLDAQVAARLDHHTRGFLAASGSARSHGALIARALGVPAVTGIDVHAEHLRAAETILVDGEEGIVIVNPDQTTLDRYRAALARSAIQPSERVPGFTVMADLDRAERVEDACAAGAEGIGLYRTELEVLARAHLLDETSQEALYTRVIRAGLPGPVSIRLFDLGYDKAVPELALAAEDNPALGLRGARLLQERPEILRVQARAIARASRHGAVDVIYPMIASIDQFLDLKARFYAAIEGLEHGPLRHGVMLEVPSACLQARHLLAAADFARIGTSDLTQYLFAVDRDHPGPAFQSFLDLPVLWELLSDLARIARDANKPLSACGVVAAGPDYTERLIAAGIRVVSVEPRRIAAVREAAARALLA